MRAAIITAPRPGNVSYLRDTLQHVTASMPTELVRVFSDSLESDGEVAQRVPVTYATQEHLDWVKRVGCVGSLNFARAADWVSQDKHGVVFEDDVELAAEWPARSKALAEVADEMFPDGWLMTLVHYYCVMVNFRHLRKVEAARASLLRWFNPGSFYGAQGVMMSQSVASVIGDTIRRNIDAEPSVWFGDYAIKNFCERTGTPMLACDPCLVQHVGHVSTFALGRPIPTSKNYRAK